MGDGKARVDHLGIETPLVVWIESPPGGLVQSGFPLTVQTSEGSPTMFSNQPSAHARPPARVTLTAVSETRVSEGGKPYFVARFKSGVLGKPVARTFWAAQADDGTATWPRIAPDDLRLLVGADLTGEVEIVAVDIEPEEFVNDRTGEVHEVSSRSVVRFADETVERATRRSGSRLRQPTATPPAPVPQAAPPPAQALAVHGDGYAGAGGQVVPA